MKSAEIERMEWWAQNKPASGVKFGEYWVRFEVCGQVFVANGATLYAAIDNAIADNVRMLDNVD